MLSGNNQPNISYLGIPREHIKGDFTITSYKDILSLILDVCVINSRIHANTVCLDAGEIDFHESFFLDVIEEEDPEISSRINSINSLINKNSLKICFFVGKEHFLGSQIESVKENTVLFLNRLSSILDLLGINYPSIIVRIGSAYGNRKQTMKLFCERLSLLSDRTRQKLCVTNDDKPSLFSITDLLSGIYYESGIPLCFRSLPHQFNDGGLSIREALFLAASTWRPGQKPFYIHSESEEINENGISISPNPVQFLSRRIPTFGLDCDVIIDSPKRELSYIKYMKTYKALPPTIINKILKK
jgi:UV DNA damage repair endonuclease